MQIIRTLLTCVLWQVYDIRRQNCYNMSATEEFLNMKPVKEALGVPQDIKYVSCSRVVNQAMTEDIMRNLEVGIPELLADGIKMLVYVGEYDFICNWLGKILSYRFLK